MSGKVYTGQTALRINFDLEDDITNYASVVINVQQPTGTTATWTATVSDASTGAIYFSNFTTTTLPVPRTYLLQPLVTFTDGTSLKGETKKLVVWDEFE